MSRGAPLGGLSSPVFRGWPDRILGRRKRGQSACHAPQTCPTEPRLTWSDRISSLGRCTQSRALGEKPQAGFALSHFDFLFRQTSQATRAFCVDKMLSPAPTAVSVPSVGYPSARQLHPSASREGARDNVDPGSFSGAVGPQVSFTEGGPLILDEQGKKRRIQDRGLPDL